MKPMARRLVKKLSFGFDTFYEDVLMADMRSVCVPVLIKKQGRKIIGAMAESAKKQGDIEQWQKLQGE